MKKILAMLIAVTAVLSTFTACGDEPESSSSEISSSISESSEEETEPVTTETTAAETTEATTTAKTTTVAETTAVAETETTTEADGEQQENTDISANSYTDVEHAEEYIVAVKKLFEAEVNADAMAMIELSFPTSVLDGMTKTGMIDMMLEQVGDIDNDLTSEQLDDVENIDIEIISARKPEDSELEFVRRQYSSVKGMCDCMIKAGITYDMLMSDTPPENLTDEEILQLAEEITRYSDTTADIELTIDFPTYEYVTFAFNGETIELPVFTDEDGTAKVDLMMLGSSIMGN